MVSGLMVMFAVGSVNAQIDTPTPSPTPIAQNGSPQKPTPTPASRVNNCDVCGYCEGMAKAPSDWQSCRACVYPQFDDKAGANGEVDPFSKITLIDAPATDIYHYYTSLGCISTQPGEFAQQIANVFFGVVGGLAFLTFLYGIGIVATSQGNPERLNYGKRMVYGAVAGLLFAIFSVGIIQFLTSGLGLPGFN